MNSNLSGRVGSYISMFLPEHFVLSCVVFMALSSSGRRNLAPNLSKLKWISEKRVGKASFGAKLSHYINIYLLSFEKRERKSDGLFIDF